MNNIPSAVKNLKYGEWTSTAIPSGWFQVPPYTVIRAPLQYLFYDLGKNIYFSLLRRIDVMPNWRMLIRSERENEMTYIAKIFWSDRLEILQANSLTALARIVGQALEVDFTMSPVNVEFSVKDRA